MKTRAFVVVAAVAAAIGAATYWRIGRALPLIDAGDPVQVAQGQTLYKAHCAQCHGSNLEGQPNWRTRLPNGRLPAPPHDAEGHTWHHPDQVLFDLIRNGLAPVAAPGYQSDMPTFKDVLTDREIAAILAFIKSRWPAEIQARQARLNE
jgi:S-disulfanyl-L-cysteine oxidoreductase SoxD